MSLNTGGSPRYWSAHYQSAGFNRRTLSGLRRSERPFMAGDSGGYRKTDAATI
jgi:hypothetical protein